MTIKGLPLLAAPFLLAGCTHSPVSDKANTVNVAAAIEHPAKITTSQLGSKIRFVPLETSDTSLIGNNWQIAFTDDRAIVANIGAEAGVLVFDLADGRFLNRIGQVGQGPEDYAAPFFFIDPATSQLVFMSGTGGYIGFSPDGKCNGTVLPGYKVREAMMLALSDSIAFTVDKEDENSREIIFKTMRTNSEPVDSFIAFKGEPWGHFPHHYDGPTTHGQFNSPLRHSTQAINYTLNKGNITIHGDVFPMSAGKNAIFKEAMCDTLYRFTPSALVPELVFDMGGHNYPVGELNRRSVKPEDLFVTAVTLTPRKAVFGVSRGWVGDNDHTLYIGTYDRQTGETRMTLASEGITDDLGGFIPFAPAFSNPKGDLIGIITTEDIEEWYEEHPDFPRPDWLNNLQDDANPVLVIVSE